MPGFAVVLIALAGTALLLFLLWFFLIAAKPVKKDRTAPFLRPYAHRGLYGGAIPENSLPAFRRAVELGFAIELDVQLSADGEVFVFHDYNLKRMCGVDGLLSDIPAHVLRNTHLDGTEYTIPAFAEVLEAVAGRVPLLIELKGENFDTALCPRVAALLDTYEGEWCVESFNPVLLRWFRKHRKNAVRGLLVTDLIRSKKSGSKFVNFALSAEWMNVLCRPAFIAYDRNYPHSVARKLNVARGALPFVYTVRDPAEYKEFLRGGVYPIFEHFVPDTPEKREK